MLFKVNDSIQRCVLVYPAEYISDAPEMLHQCDLFRNSNYKAEIEVRNNICKALSQQPSLVSKSCSRVNIRVTKVEKAMQT